MLLKRLRSGESILFDGVRIKNLSGKSIQIGLSNESGTSKHSTKPKPTLSAEAKTVVRKAKERERV